MCVCVCVCVCVCLDNNFGEKNKERQGVMKEGKRNGRKLIFICLVGEGNGKRRKGSDIRALFSNICNIREIENLRKIIHKISLISFPSILLFK